MKLCRGRIDDGGGDSDGRKEKSQQDDKGGGTSSGLRYKMLPLHYQIAMVDVSAAADDDFCCHGYYCYALHFLRHRCLFDSLLFIHFTCPRVFN